MRTTIIDERNLADTTIAACEEIKAAAAMPTDAVLTTMERQQKAVALKASRCPRCGQHNGDFFNQASFCSTCLAHFRALDQAAHPAMWFSEMLDSIRKSQGERSDLS